MKTTMSILFVGLALLVGFTGCTTVDDNDPAAAKEEEQEQALDTADEVVAVQVGQRVTLPTYSASLTFAEKAEDSRCPKNVTCVWEGRVKIVLTFTVDGQTETFEMTGFVGPTGQEEGSPPRVVHEALGFRFALERLDPYPVDGAPQTDTPTATIRVERL